MSKKAFNTIDLRKQKIYHIKTVTQNSRMNYLICSGVPVVMGTWKWYHVKPSF